MNTLVSKRSVAINSSFDSTVSLPVSGKDYNIKFREQHSDVLIFKQKDDLDVLLKDPNSENYHSDVWVLTQSDRLKALSAENLNQVLQTRFAQRKETIRDVKDDVLFKCIISRRMDSASERLNYLNHLEQELNMKNDELREILENAQNGVVENNNSDSDNVNTKTETV